MSQLQYVFIISYLVSNWSHLLLIIDESLHLLKKMANTFISRLQIHCQYFRMERHPHLHFKCSRVKKRSYKHAKLTTTLSSKVIVCARPLTRVLRRHQDLSVFANVLPESLPCQQDEHGRHPRGEEAGNRSLRPRGLQTLFLHDVPQLT